MYKQHLSFCDYKLYFKKININLLYNQGSLPVRNVFFYLCVTISKYIVFPIVVHIDKDGSTLIFLYYLII